MIRQDEPEANPFVLTDLDSVRALVGRAAGSDGESEVATLTLGEISLLPHQRDAIVRLRSVISRFGGALLADDVGMGKTFVALGAAREYARVHVLAPAALVPMWLAAIARAAAPQVLVRSLHRFSGERAPAAHEARAPRNDVRTAPRELVIIDEAHYLRNGSTARYRAVSRFTAGRDVLLLSATPLHNSASDLRNMLGLFAGSRSDLLAPELLSQLIVRRDAAAISEYGRPEVVERPPIAVPFDAGTLSGLLALPAPLPAHDGAVAGALIRLGLLRAWCSSDAALSAALKRRALRGSALQCALEAGRHPTSSELRTWLVGEQEVQLAFPELMASQEVSSGPLLQVLSRHVRAVAELLAHHERVATGDSARVGALREMLDAHPGEPVLAFSQFAGTVRALYRALADIAGVGAMSSERGQIASGPIARSEVLGRFAPVAQGVPPPPPHQALRLLIATDVLAEGVNLQDAGVLVHLDVPWTDALLRQRVGRVVRMGALHPQVHVYRFAIPDGVERAIRLLERVHRKAEQGFRLVGGGRTARSAASLASHIRSCLVRWRALTLRGAERPPRAVSPLVAVAYHSGECLGWLALVRVGNELRLLACASTRSPADSLHADCALTPLGAASDDVRVIATVIDAIDSAAASESLAIESPRADHVSSHEHLRFQATTALRGIHHWLDAREVRRDTGAQPASMSDAHRRVERQLQTVVASAPSVHRGPLVRLADEAFTMLASSRGAGAERALEAWYATRSERSAAAWLSEWVHYPSLTRVRPDTHDDTLSARPPGTEHRPEAVARVEALILLAAPPRRR